MAPNYFLVLPFFLFTAAAEKNLSVKAFLSPASHNTQIDVTMSQVIQDKVLRAFILGLRYLSRTPRIEFSKFILTCVSSICRNGD